MIPTTEKLVESKGYLITFEGIDGSGKSTIARHINSFLKQHGINSFLVESGGMPQESIVMQIKEITHNPANKNIAWTTETYLYLASLSQKVEEYIIPHLRKNEIILTDRFVMSVLVLAHYARRQPRKLVMEMINLATKGLYPNLTILCDLEVSVAMKRKISSGSNLSRKESEGEELIRCLRNAYLKEAEKLGDNCVILKTGQLSREEMLNKAEEIVKKKIKNIFLWKPHLNS